MKKPKNKKSNHDVIINLQLISKSKNVPTLRQFRLWVNTTLAQIKKTRKQYELTLRIVTPSESQQLNSYYRKKNYPTNVLSFPCVMPVVISPHLLGDIVICAAVVRCEAKLQCKDVEAHWAHLVVHGVLHLFGYDHNNKRSAAVMETLECKVLKKLHFTCLY